MKDGPSPQSVARTYRMYAPLYDYLFGKILSPGRRAIAAYVSKMQPDQLLEVGIGTGLSLPLYPSATHVTGVDLCPQMLARAQSRASKLDNRNIALLQMDAEHLNFADGQFDCVVLSYVLSVTPDVDQLVAEVRRVCRRGGVILILNHFSGSRVWWLLERATSAFANRVGFRSDFRYSEHVLRHSWKVESSKDVNIFGLSKLVVIQNA